MAEELSNGVLLLEYGKDTMWGIANKYLSTYGKECDCTTINDYMKYLADLNGIKDGKTIIAGHKFYLTAAAKNGDTGSGSGSPSANKPTASNQVKIVRAGLKADSSSGRELYVEWEFNNPNLNNYSVEWWGGWSQDGVNYAHAVSTSTCTEQWATYEVPERYTVANVRVKPNSKTRKVNDVDTPYFTGIWSGMDQTDTGAPNCTRHVFEVYAPLGTPPDPTVTIKGNTLTAELTGIADNVTFVQFEIIKNNDDSAGAYKLSDKIPVTARQVSYSVEIEIGGKYKVRARYINENGTGDWGPDSENKGTKPNAPTGITKCIAKTETSVSLEWAAVTNAEAYDIQYTTKKEYFDGSNELTTMSGIETTQYQITGLESGQEYFFRIRAVNDSEDGYSAWTEPVSVIVGTEPAAPTTWSSTTTVITGEALTLYWIHNSEDGSAQTKAEVEVLVKTLATDSSVLNLYTSTDAGITTTTDVVYDNTHKTATYIATITTSNQVDEDERTMFCHVTTSGLSEGATIEWRVRTAGATGVYGEWSITRTVDIYTPPTMSINLTDSSGNAITTLTQFPLYICGSAGPKTQTPVGYHFSVISDSYYETIDDLGRPKVVTAGQEVYSKYVDSSTYTPMIELSAGDIDLENNVTYTVKCTLSMNSGLTGDDAREFIVKWTEERYDPDAELGVNYENLTALLRPFCKDENGNILDGVMLSVYRREFDGSFTELIRNLDNTKGSYIIDPHPALDYARYRIVAISEATGAVSYTDLPGYPVSEKAIVIQWDESWSTFDVVADMVVGDPPWTGSLLKLPYNIDISDDHKPDISLVKYIGRDHPVTYYGTQKGHTASWSVEIPKTDKETLYAIRRLASWMGDVYVREPSGTGYWANITVSYSQKHLDTVIPIRFSVTRVAGGA